MVIWSVVWKGLSTLLRVNLTNVHHVLWFMFKVREEALRSIERDWISLKMIYGASRRTERLWALLLNYVSLWLAFLEHVKHSTVFNLNQLFYKCFVPAAPLCKFKQGEQQVWCITVLQISFVKLWVSIFLMWVFLYYENCAVVFGVPNSFLASRKFQYVGVRHMKLLKVNSR